MGLPGDRKNLWRQKPENREKEKKRNLRHYHIHKKEKEYRIKRGIWRARFIRAHPELEDRMGYYSINRLISRVEYIERKASDEELESLRGFLDDLSAKNRKSKGSSELE